MKFSSREDTLRGMDPVNNLGLILVGLGTIWYALSLPAYSLLGLILPYPVMLGVGLSLVGKLLELWLVKTDERRGWLALSAGADFAQLLGSLTITGLGSVLGFWGPLLYLVSAWGYLRFLERQTVVLPTGWLRYLPYRMLGWLALVFVLKITPLGPWVGSLWNWVFGLIPLMIACRRMQPRARTWGWANWWEQRSQALRIQGSDADFTRILGQIRERDQKAKSLGRLGVWMMVGGLVMLFPAAFLLEEGSDANNVIALLLFGVIGVGGLLWALGDWGDIEDTRYEGLERIKAEFNSKLAPGDSWAYQLEIRPLDRARYFSEASRFGPVLTLPRGFVNSYHAPVLEGRMTLSDGVEIEFTLAKDVEKTTTYEPVPSYRESWWETKREFQHTDHTTIQIRFPKVIASVETVQFDGTKFKFDPSSLVLETNDNQLVLKVQKSLTSSALDVDTFLALVRHALAVVRFQ